MEHGPDLFQDGRPPTARRQARGVCLRPGRCGGRKALRDAPDRPPFDRLPAAVCQSPDYPLPTTACLLQDRLGLPTAIGALDFNLGCSGFVYGLSLADGLIQSGAAQRVLLITAETYSKYIHPTDRSLRTIFGDGAAATLIEAAERPSLGSFVFGTDGRKGDILMVPEGGRTARRKPRCAPQAQALAQHPIHGRPGTGQVHPGSRAADDRADFAAAVGPATTCRLT